MIESFIQPGNVLSVSKEKQVTHVKKMNFFPSSSQFGNSGTSKQKFSSFSSSNRESIFFFRIQSIQILLTTLFVRFKQLEEEFRLQTKASLYAIFGTGNCCTMTFLLRIGGISMQSLIFFRSFWMQKRIWKMRKLES